MYNYPYEYYRQQNMNTMNLNQMDNMQDMGYQQPLYNQMNNMQGQGQQPLHNQMPTMPMQPVQSMQPIQPMMPMGTVTQVGATNGVPVPGSTSGPLPTNIGSVPLETLPVGESPIMDVQFTQGYLRTQIGKRVKVEFLIGTNMLIDREGTLVDVGISFIIINEVETDDLLLCDMYSIKFVRFYY